jgi:F-type H+-transporting ATPase subunit b
MNITTQFAAANAPSGDLFSALGIDWKMLVFQLIAFAVLVWLLGKFVYPSLIKVVDDRQNEIEAGSKAAEAAKKQAGEAKTEVEKALKQARLEASDIVSTAKEEAAAALEKAEAKSKERAERIVADAHDQITKDVVAAKKALHNETLELVAQVTEKVLGKTVTAKVDKSVISAAIKEAK